MSWNQAYYDSAIGAGIPSDTAAYIASAKDPGAAYSYALSVHQPATAAQATTAKPPPPAPPPIQAPEAVALRPDTQVGIKRKKSRRDALGLTNRGASSAFSYAPSAGLGGVGGSGMGL